MDFINYSQEFDLLNQLVDIDCLFFISVEELKLKLLSVLMKLPISYSTSIADQYLIHCSAEEDIKFDLSLFQDEKLNCSIIHCMKRLGNRYITRITIKKIIKSLRSHIH